jgi:hypothetical protein
LPPVPTHVLAELLWQALKERCCVKPATAVRIVLLNRADVENAVLQVAQRISTNPETSRSNEHSH